MDPDAAVPIDSGADAQTDSGHEPDAADAGDAEPPDAGQDAGSDAACPTVVRDGGPLPNGQTNLGDGLLLHFDETGAIAEAANTNGQGGVAICQVPGSCPVGNECGVFDRSVRFTGSSGLLLDRLPFRAVALEPYAVEAWVRLSPTMTSTGCILQGVDESGVLTELSFCITPDGRPLLETATPALGTAAIGKGEWHHVAVHRTLDDVTFYVDGVAGPTEPYTAGVDRFGNTFYIGSDAVPDRGHHFVGSLDELRYHRGITFFPEVDLSVNQPNGHLVWAQNGEIWISAERGHRARRLVERGTSPRISPNGRRIAFLRCEPGGAPCGLHVVDLDGANEVEVIASSDPMPPVASAGTAFSLNGAFLFYARGTGCAQEVWRVSIQSGATTLIRAAGEVLSLDVEALFDGAGNEETMLIAWVDCGGAARTTSVVRPGSGSPTESTSFGPSLTERYSWVRLNKFFTGGDMVIQVDADGLDPLSHRASPMGTLAQSFPPGARRPAYGYRPSWFYFTDETGEFSPPGSIVLRDYSMGGAATVTVVAATSSAAPATFADFQAPR